MTAAAAVRRRHSTADYEGAHARLCALCQPGTTIYTVLRGITRSGLTRYLDFFVIEPASADVCLITPYIATVLKLKQTDDGYIAFRGWGTDCARQIVHLLSFELHGLVGKGAGFDPASSCDVTDSENYRAGYSLKQEWL